MPEAANVVPPDGGQPTPAPAEPTPTPAPTPAEPTPTPAPTPAEPTWLDSLSPESRALAESRHWDSAEAMATSYKNLESLRGVPETELLRIPKNDDADGWAKTFDRLGRPKEPGEYTLELGDTVQEGFTDFMKQAMHKNGLTTSQAEGFANEWREYTQQQLTAANEEFEAKIEAENQELQRTWGAAYEQNVKTATRAAKEFGMSGDQLDALEQVMGYKGVMEMMHSIGQKIGEAPFHDGDSSTGSEFGVLTPEQAKQQWNDLKSDESFMKNLYDNSLPGHKSAMERKARLYKFMYPK